MDFFRITSSSDDCIIEWSSDSCGKNVRVKRKEKDKWLYGSTNKAKFAETTGRNLLFLREENLDFDGVGVA